MAKKTAVAEPSVEDQLRSELSRKDAALGEARKGLFRIAGTDPVKFVGSPGSSTTGFKAFEYVKVIAERTILNISDAEAPVNG